MVYRPLMPRVWIFIVTSFYGYGFTFVLVDRFVPVDFAPTVLGLIVIVLAAVRSWGLRLVIDDDTVVFQNLFRTHRLPVSSISSLELRPLFESRSFSQKPSQLAYVANRFPALAFGLENGKLSSLASVSMFVGPRSRRMLVSWLKGWADAREIPIGFHVPNGGHIAGLLWDVTLGYQPGRTRLAVIVLAGLIALVVLGTAVLVFV